MVGQAAATFSASSSMVSALKMSLLVLVSTRSSSWARTSSAEWKGFGMKL